MPDGRISRPYSRDFKPDAVRRLQYGESGSALALELGGKRTLIHRWRDAVRAGGELVLRDKLARVRHLRAVIGFRP